MSAPGRQKRYRAVKLDRPSKARRARAANFERPSEAERSPKGRFRSRALRRSRAGVSGLEVANVGTCGFFERSSGTGPRPSGLFERSGSTGARPGNLSSARVAPGQARAADSGAQARMSRLEVGNVGRWGVPEPARPNEALEVHTLLRKFKIRYMACPFCTRYYISLKER